MMKDSPSRAKFMCTDMSLTFSLLSLHRNYRLHRDALLQERAPEEPVPVEEELVVPTIFFNSTRMIVLVCKLVLRLSWWRP